jgi:VIT1/CCC1 family predicted Fe2+/Mn2+ transporter/rubrerythrin
MDNQKIRQYKENLQAELDSASLYRSMAGNENKKELQTIYIKMAVMEEKHAQFWIDKLNEAGVKNYSKVPSWRSRSLSFLAKKFGTRFVLPTVVELEDGGGNSYAKQPESKNTNMPAEEQQHSRMFKAIMNNQTEGIEGSEIAKYEGRHKGVGGNALRAAVLGANDGLLSNMNLVMGVAGAAAGSNAINNHSILITGFAGMLAGALSMAIGEWLSVQSSRELYQKQIKIEENELIANPEEEMEELALIYQAKGLPADKAQELAAHLISSKETALDTLTREELGIDPDELGGSAWEAAGTSFFLFAIGAFLPVLPFLIIHSSAAIAASMGLSMLGLFGMGAIITIMTGKNLFVSGLRQLFLGFLSSGITFAVGWILGTSVF